MINPYIRTAAFIALCVFGVANVVLAKQDRMTAVNTQSDIALSIPERAVQVSENVFSLGSAIDPAVGDVVEGYMFIHKKKGEVKPPGTPGKGGGGGDNVRIWRVW